MARFQNALLRSADRLVPSVLITTGNSPVVESTIRAFRARGVVCAHYSTDDPWNPNQRAEWLLEALPAYDLVFTPRHQNLADFASLPCRVVDYLPFAYDPELVCGSDEAPRAPAPDVLFVGGADSDRVAFFNAYLAAGVPITLVGGYWERHVALRSSSLGHLSAGAVAALTARAKVNLCLVRRANRDDHVMRSFEIPANGGCMIVEDTPDHRRFFGEDGAAAVYFRTPQEAAARVRALLPDAQSRRRLAQAAHDLILRGGHTYADRLQTMLAKAAELGHALGLGMTVLLLAWMGAHGSVLSGGRHHSSGLSVSSPRGGRWALSA